MLKETNSSQHIENLKYLANEEMRDVYQYMIGHAACLRDYACYPNSPSNEKNKRDFQYHINNRQPFAFIVRNKHLLFYFRNPAMETYDPDKIRKTFPNTNNKNGAGEITVRIKTLTEAKALLHFVFS